MVHICVQLCPCTTFTRMSEVFCPCLCASLSMYHCIHKNACVFPMSVCNFVHVLLSQECLRFFCPCTTAFTRMPACCSSIPVCNFVHVLNSQECLRFFVHICVRLCAAVSAKTELREKILPDQPPRVCCDGVCKFVMLQR